MTAALEEGEWSATHPGRTLPSGKIRYPFYTRMGGPQGRSGRAQNFVPTGIFFRSLQLYSVLYGTIHPWYNGNKELFSDIYWLSFSVVCSLDHYVASWSSILPGSICDVAVRHSHILIVARGFGTWASACRVLHPVLLHALNGVVTFTCL